MSIAFAIANSSAVAASPGTVALIINIGDTVVVCQTCDGSNIVVTDDGGNTYTLKNTNSNTRIFTSANVANPASLVTITFTGGTTCVMVVGTYTGVEAIGNTGTASQNGVTVATIDLAIRKGNDWVAAAIDCLAAAATITYTPSVGNLRDTQISNANKRMMGLCDNTAPAPGIVTNTVLVNSSLNPRNVAVELIAQVNIDGFVSMDY